MNNMATLELSFTSIQFLGDKGISLSTKWFGKTFDPSYEFQLKVENPRTTWKGSALCETGICPIPTQ